MRMVRVLDPTVQQLGRGRVGSEGSGIQVNRRTSGVMVMSTKVRVRLAVWVGEMLFGGRTGGGMVMSATVRVRLVVWIGGKGGAELDSRTR